MADLLAAAHAVAASPASTRAAHAMQIVDQATTADRYCQALHRVHPEWGDGTLLSAAGPARAAAEITPRASLDAMRLVIEAILDSCSAPWLDRIEPSASRAASPANATRS